MSRTVGLTIAVGICGWLTGCGTTRMTDSPRSATEQMLISEAVDRAVSQLDFRTLRGKRVYFDSSFVDARLDKGYVISSIRQHVLAHGCLLQERRDDAEYVIEARIGGVGTDRHALLIGVPEMSLPAMIPGQPSRIPEIPFAKKTDQHGVAKVAVFAYNRLTGERVWQSGVVKSQATAKDLWLLGAGPFQHGSIRTRTTLAGEIISVPFYEVADNEQASLSAITTTQQNAWPERAQAPAGKVAVTQAEMIANVLPLSGATAGAALLANESERSKQSPKVSRHKNVNAQPRSGG